MRRSFFFIVLTVVLLGIVPITAAQQDQRCFEETGFCISGRIREFWQQNGGLPVFGYPTGPQQEVMIENRPLQAQTFERNRIELHPENPRPYDVQLGRLGVDRLTQQERDWFTFPKSAAQDDCRFFEETGHNICGEILAMWRANGLEFDGIFGKTEDESIALFGLPISDVQTEEVEGKPYQVQWFERGRFELHPENQPPFNVLLGLLGNEMRDHGMSPTPTATPQPTGAPQPTASAEPTPATQPTVSPQPTSTPTLPAPSFNNCQADPTNADNAPNFPVKIVDVNDRDEIVRLQNVSTELVSLDGWRMCSITGNQEHLGISGTLAPGEESDFPYEGTGSIWSNSEDDDGALYNANGQLVSYRQD
jgi:hypothetical protein